jgi:hypothetical protein
MFAVESEPMATSTAKNLNYSLETHPKSIDSFLITNYNITVLLNRSIYK